MNAVTVGQLIDALQEHDSDLNVIIITGSDEWVPALDAIEAQPDMGVLVVGADPS